MSSVETLNSSGSESTCPTAQAGEQACIDSDAARRTRAAYKATVALAASAIFISLLTATAVAADTTGGFYPRCGKTFMTVFETGRRLDDGTFQDGYSKYRSVRKTDVISLHKIPRNDGVFMMTVKTLEKPGYETIRVAPNLYRYVLQCIDGQ